MLNKDIILLVIVSLIGCFLALFVREKKVTPSIKMQVFKSQEEIRNIFSEKKITFSENYIIDSLDFVKSSQLKHKSLGFFGYETNYYIEFMSYIDVHNKGEYLFFLDSDDGYAFFIDGNMISSFAGTRANKENKIALLLEKGIHKIKINYFQALGSSKIKVRYRNKIEKTETIFGLNTKDISFLDIRENYDNLIAKE